MEIGYARPEDYQEVLALTMLLWPDFDAKELTTLLETSSPKNEVILTASIGSTMVGIVFVSLRTDYVEGSSTSPVGYLEGLYVSSTHRRAGIAKALIAEAEQWCLQQGCTEIASDTELSNDVSQRLHRALGFNEANRIVHFIRSISNK